MLGLLPRHNSFIRYDFGVEDIRHSRPSKREEFDYRLDVSHICEEFRVFNKRCRDGGSLQCPDRS